MNAPKQKIGLVGLGMALRPHLKSLHDLSDQVDIGAAWTPSPHRREAAARDLGLPVADTLEALLADPDIGSVLLLTPPLTHLDLIGRCAAAGKHVLVEKPLDVSTDRALQAIRLMEDAGLRLGVVLQHRFRPAAMALRTLMRAGELGRLVSASASIRWWRTPAYYAEPGRGMLARDGGGVLLTQAIHTLDLLLDLAGPVRRITALTRNAGLRATDTEDIACGAVEFDNGAIGSIDATTVSYPGFPERIELACERGTAVMTGEALDVYRQDGRREHVDPPAFERDSSDPMAFDHGAHRAVIQDFLDSTRTDRPPMAHGRSALRVQSLIEGFLQSSERQCAVTLSDHSR
ncbi:MAG: Gfo/Idh/MocA family oxidoreductase [Castellaniella sp.]|uniref:Gfo/Idh/MocA family protein n=1 Tax=Castellaniella sp. TaxID=1955812 RepID=UPI003C724B7F